MANEENKDIKTQKQEEAEKDINIIDELKRKHQEELEAEKLKYNVLYKKYCNGERSSTEPQKPTIDPKQVYEDNVKKIMTNKMNDLEQAKTLLEIDDYRQSIGEKSIFVARDGIPNEGDIDSAENCRAVLEDAIERSEGDNGVFLATVTSKLIDNKYSK